MLVSKTIPNLINGVSQQPDALRMDTQCAEQENAYPSVVEGLTKRLPTEHVAQTNLTADAKTTVHTINRDDPEKYTVLLRDQQIRVYDKDGALKTVEMGADTGADNDNVTYLDTDNADTALKALTIADVTYIVNTEKTTAMAGITRSSVAPNEALVFVRQAFSDSQYDIFCTQQISGATTQVNATLNVTSGFNNGVLSANAIASQLASQLDSSTNPVDTDPTNPSSAAYGTNANGGASSFLAQSWQVGSTNSISGFAWKSDVDLRGRQLFWRIHANEVVNGVNQPKGIDAVEGFQSQGILAETQKYGANVNEEQVVTWDSPFVPQANTIYWISCARYYNDGEGDISLTPPYSGWVVGDNNLFGDGNAYYSASNPSGSSQPGKDFWLKLVSPSGAVEGNLTASAFGPIIYISSPSPFTISSLNTYSNSYIGSFKDKAQKLSDLPTSAKDGMIIQIEGDVDAGQDDYYLKFVTNAFSGEIGEGVWEECAAPGLENGLEPNPASMPHLLIKQPNGTFVFKKADGENHTSSATGTPTYDYSAFKWGSRLVGDKTTNPDPTFIGRTINNMFLFKNRFGFLSDENIILSEAGEYFNFFRTTVIDLLDTAPIDIASASSEVSILRHAVPLAEKLVVLSDAGQFILQSDTALSSKTVAMARSTAYNILKDAEPSASENAVFFAFNRGSFSGVREYIPSDVEDNFEAIDISAQIPKYIPGKITKIIAANHENVVFCMTEGDPDALYVYNYYNGDRQRIQSAWHRWEFGAGAKILNIDLIDTDLYLTVYRTGGVFIEKIAIEVGKADAGSNYVARLDRRVSNTSTGVSVNGNLVTLPYTVTSGRSIEVMTASGKRLTASLDGDSQVTFNVGEDMTGVSFFAGEAYTMSYTFSDLVLREQTKTGGLAVMTDGRIQVRYGTLTFGESGSFSVAVTPDFRDTSTHTFTGRILGAGSMKLGEVPLESGELRFPVFSKADQVNVTVTNDAPLPCNLLSAEYEISWNPRSRRM